MLNRHGKPKFKTYPQAAIDSWRTDVANIPGEITQLRKDILNYQEQLAQLEPPLKTLIIEHIKPNDAIILSLESQIKLLTIPTRIQELEALIPPEQHALTSANHDIEMVKQVLIPMDLEIYRLRILIETCDLHLKIDSLNNKVAHQEAALHDHRKELKHLRDQKHHLNHRLETERKELQELEKQAEQEAIKHAAEIANQLHHNPKHHATGHAQVVTTVANNIEKLQARIRELEQDDHALSHSIHKQEHKINEHQQHLDLDLKVLHDDNHKFDSLASQVAGYYVNLDVEGSIFRQRLTSKMLEREPHANRYEQLENIISRHQQKLLCLQRHISQLQGEYNAALPLAKEFANNRSLSDLQTRLVSAQQLDRTHQQEKSRLNALITAEYEKISSSQREIDRKTAYHQELLHNQFMLTLRDNPETLVKALTDSIRTQLSNYEIEHPAHQSEDVRLCLVETKTKLATILNLATDNKLGTLQTYYQICGMLWKMVNQLPEEDALLSNCLLAILAEHPVDANEALAEYQHLDLPALTAAELNAIQYTEYDNAYRELFNALAQVSIDGSKIWRDFQVKGQDVLYVIDQCKRDAVETGDPHFDLKYHTTVLLVTTQLTRDPSNRQLQQRYHNLTLENQHGKPSLAKKVVGALLMFGGAALIVASVACKILSVGIAAPITFAGIGAGAGMFVVGLGMFGWGVQKGASRKMDRFGKAAIKAGVSPRMFPLRVSKERRSSLIDTEESPMLGKSPV